MRISTTTLFENASNRLSDLQTALQTAQQQISTGRRMLTPADDPVASARVLEVTQSQSINAQFASNRGSARDSLSLEESSLQSVTGLLQDVKTQIVNAGSGVLDTNQRKYIASELSIRFNELLSLANTRDGVGNYMFAGFQVASQPFVETATGASYVGDQGQRLLQVGPARQMALNDAGDSVFDAIKTGNGTFVAAANAGNTGSGVVSPGSVVNAALLTGDNYTVTFNVVGGTTTYDVVNTTTATTVSSGNAYAGGQSIAFDGLQIDINGAPANGDQFTVAPSANQSIFTTLKNLIGVLNSSGPGATANAVLTNGLKAANGNVDNALDNILSTRASIGARLKELDALDSSGSDRDLQYSQTISGLQDLDYTKAISQLTEQQTILTASQQSFVKITGLSLFNYLGG
jgi:flagellar hook-associated protein 3 FlgL